MYCQKLNLNFTLDTTVLDTVKSSHKSNLSMIFKIKKEDVDKRFRTFLRELNLAVYHAEIFYTKPDGNLFIHIDTETLSNNCKLNWVYGGTNSKMVWWQQQDPDEPLSYKLTPIGTKYISFDKDKCTRVWEEEIGTPSLVNVGIPHSIDNPGSEGRWCISFVLYDLEKTQLLQWSDAVKKFSPYII